MRLNALPTPAAMQPTWIVKGDVCTTHGTIVLYIHLYSPNKIAIYINEQINKQKESTSKKKHTIKCKWAYKHRRLQYIESKLVLYSFT